MEFYPGVWLKQNLSCPPHPTHSVTLNVLLTFPQTIPSGLFQHDYFYPSKTVVSIYLVQSINLWLFVHTTNLASPSANHTGAFWTCLLNQDEQLLDWPWAAAPEEVEWIPKVQLRSNCVSIKKDEVLFFTKSASEQLTCTKCMFCFADNTSVLEHSNPWIADLQRGLHWRGICSLWNRRHWLLLGR